MRYPDNATSSLHVSAIESQPQQHHQNQPQQQPFPAYFQPPPILPSVNISSSSAYSHDPGSYYHHPPPPAPHILARLGSSTSPSNMASHGHRNSALAHSTASISARGQYAGDTPAFRRPSGRASRSPSYPGTLRRAQPLSPAPSPIPSFTSPTRMDTGGVNSGYGSKSPVNFPPLGPISLSGQLEYVNSDGSPAMPIKCEIGGAIDKGFFLADGEWTCYRRNYFSCTCSFTLSPTPFHGCQIQYSTDDNAYPVRGFYMSISAIVADDGNQSIELVQHTPKRDKGPITKPEKIRLDAKPPMSHQHHHHHQHHQSMAVAAAAAANMYHPHDHSSLVASGRSIYDPTTGFSSPQGGGIVGGPGPGPGPGNNPTEYTFERIQFKQATANNGKRRAAQQYYLLCIELWAECIGHPETLIKIASKKSAKMIVRGRSPGHYSDTRRNSTSNGPGGSAGSISGYAAGAAAALSGGGMLSDFSPNAGLAGSGFGGYEPRGGGGGSGHHPPGLHYMRGPRDIPTEAYVSPEDDKSIHTTKEYQYYPGSIYENQQDSRHGIAMFTHPTATTAHRDDHHQNTPVTMGATAPGSAFGSPSRVKNEGETTAGGGMALPSIFNPGSGVASRRCQPFEGKHTSNSYYPTMMPQLSLNMAHIS